MQAFSFQIKPSRGVSSRLSGFPQCRRHLILLEMIPSSWTSIIHYSTRSSEPLSSQLRAVFHHRSIYDRGVCRAVQLNVKDPQPDELTRLRGEFPELDIVVQVPLWRPDLENPENMIGFAKPYTDIDAHLLFDPSGGRGKSPDSRKLQMISEAAAALPLRTRIVFAGGLSGDNVAEVCGQIYEFTRRPFSIDAEGKLRGGRYKGQKIGDKMNPDKVFHYMDEASRELYSIAVQENWH